MHSPEPWKAIPYSGPAPNFRLFGITSGDGKTLYAGVSGQTVEQSLANAERIVACVNFCRGISTKDLIARKPLAMETLQRQFMEAGDRRDWDECNRLESLPSPPASQQPG